MAVIRNVCNYVSNDRFGIKSIKLQHKNTKLIFSSEDNYRLFSVPSLRGLTNCCDTLEKLDTTARRAIKAPASRQ